MKIKHFAGYGNVDAKKISTKRVGVHGELTNVVIRVVGNHEWGIYRTDKYDVVQWLGKRLIKDLEDDRCITSMTVTPSYEKGADGTDVDVCEYDITYAPTRDISYKYYVSPSW